MTPRRPGTQSFNIRLNALDFKDFQDRVSLPITVLPNVTFHKTLLDRFIDTFKEQVANNPRYETQQVDNILQFCFDLSSVRFLKAKYFYFFEFFFIYVGNGAVHWLYANFVERKIDEALRGRSRLSRSECLCYVLLSADVVHRLRG